MNRPSFSDRYFDDLYASDPDPWRFATSDYERAKYAATLAALPDRSFDNAFEVGCSIGILTRQLAPRCAHLLSVDVAEAALVQARQTCSDQPHVQFGRMRVPGEWPEGTFDLILLSEVLYFLGPDDIAATAWACLNCLHADGLILMVNWLGGTNYPCGGDEAVGLFLDACGTAVTDAGRSRTDRYRIDAVRRFTPPS